MRQRSLLLTAFFAVVYVMPVSWGHAALSKADEKKAAAEASSDADKWASSQKEAPKPVPPVEAAKPAAAPPPAVVKPPAAATVTPPPAAVVPATPAATPVAQSPSAIPVKPKKNLNQMTGKLVAIEDDPPILRLALDGGYSIEFTYSNKTVMTNGGGAIKVHDLYYGDRVQVYYAGKDLNAVEVERLEKAPRPFAE